MSLASNFDYDRMSNDDIITDIRHTQDNIRILRLENEIFEKTLSREDPNILAVVEQAMTYAAKLKRSRESMTPVSFFGKSPNRQFDSFTVGSTFSKFYSNASTNKRFSNTLSTSLRNKSVCSRNDSLPSKINCLEKTELVWKEMKVLEKIMEKKKLENQIITQKIRTELEEIIMRIEDITIMKDEFNKKVRTVREDGFIKKIPAEVWVYFMNHSNRKTDISMEKLRLRTSSLTVKCRKTISAINDKNHFQNLTSVDFENVAIRNGMKFKKLETLDYQLLRVKQMNGDSKLDNTIHKKALQISQRDSGNLQVINNDLKIATNLVIDKNDVIHTRNVASEKELIDTIDSTRKYKVPEITDYVGLKKSLYRLRKKVQRKELFKSMHCYN